jgi:predicted nucleic acid-binding protein
VKWLLDTNVVSESIRLRPDRRVLTWLAARSLEQLAVSIVTTAELQDGVALAPTASMRAQRAAWLAGEFARSFEARTLPLTVDVVTDWLLLVRRLRARGRPQSAPDLMIAATARVHDLILVSRNLRDFADTGVLLFDPWTGRHHQMDEA